MFSFQKWKLTWSVAASIASILALISVIHLFLYPVVPSLDYLSLRQAQSSCIPINGTKVNPKQNPQPMVDLKVRYPDDLHNAVTYNGAPWKAEIGRWLSGCNSNTTAIEISEKIGGKSCKNDCSGQGICNRDLGQCRCFHGFGGDGCSERLQLNCNYPGTENQPYGHWVVSICGAHCDTSRAMCFCGEGTKYPNRPVAESCGFKINPPSEPGGPRQVDWAVADQDIFTTNGSVRGWCNVDPAKAYDSKVAIKEECDCKYDGLWGRFCETPVRSVCINQCSGHGYCRGGFCQCENGWYGVDCSVPSVLSSIGKWPKWLRPAKISVSDSGQLTGNLVNLNAVVQKKRPLIYVYDLPVEFNSILLEDRLMKMEGLKLRKYSMGIRQKVAEEFGSSPDKKGKLGKQHADDVVVTPLRAENYHEEIANSVFCGVMPGDGWSGRLEDSILQGCIPVVIQDGIYLPYENVLNYESFAVRIREDEIPNLIKILRSINETEVEFKLANVKKVWHRFLYRDSVLLEADRQNATVGVGVWAVKFAEIDGDDVFNTLMQA
ncbi:probable glucuronosyltransferase gut1 [Phtheirospermum japonicum]|uniref:Probable glucuronosyltransferase gut1 n=1 Tax=Phtheirospermum japonicum TaxID=374723 RepID=A0A830BXH8_9LAMI|nr:probable glucuronosyltransferase gut1 [Phtheirospermum japonicum]